MENTTHVGGDGALNVRYIRIIYMDFYQVRITSRWLTKSDVNISIFALSSFVLQKSPNARSFEIKTLNFYITSQQSVRVRKYFLSLEL